MMDEASFAKLKEAVHFVCAAAKGMTLGSIRLSKILFCSDRSMYIKTLHSIIADAYIKGPQGPYLKDLRRAIQCLMDEHKISAKTIQIGKRNFTDYVLSKDPVLSLLTKEEAHTLESFTYTICTDYSAHDISEATHNLAWNIANKDEHIPLAAQLLVTPCPITQGSLDWAKEVCEEHTNAVQ